MIKEILCNFK